MWIWDEQLQRLGFRRRSDRYWQCERQHGLSSADHLSLFSWGEQRIPHGRHRCCFLVEMTEFHVTLVRGGEFLHWYYHEREHNEWQPCGHTSNREVLRLGLQPADLRREADVIAATFVLALGGSLLRREKEL